MPRIRESAKRKALHEKRARQVRVKKLLAKGRKLAREVKDELRAHQDITPEHLDQLLVSRNRVDFGKISHVPNRFR